MVPQDSGEQPGETVVFDPFVTTVPPRKPFR